MTETFEQLREKFHNDPHHNPMTGRSILKDGSTYKSLVKKYGLPDQQGQQERDQSLNHFGSQSVNMGDFSRSRARSLSRSRSKSRSPDRWGSHQMSMRNMFSGKRGLDLGRSVSDEITIPHSQKSFGSHLSGALSPRSMRSKLGGGSQLGSGELSPRSMRSANGSQFGSGTLSPRRSVSGSQFGSGAISPMRSASGSQFGSGALSPRRSVSGALSPRRSVSGSQFGSGPISPMRSASGSQFGSGALSPRSMRHSLGTALSIGSENNKGSMSPRRSTVSQLSPRSSRNQLSPRSLSRNNLSFSGELSPRSNMMTNWRNKELSSRSLELSSHQSGSHIGSQLGSQLGRKNTKQSVWEKSSGYMVPARENLHEGASGSWQMHRPMPKPMPKPMPHGANSKNYHEKTWSSRSPRQASWNLVTRP